ADAVPDLLHGPLPRCDGGDHRRLDPPPGEPAVDLPGHVIRSAARAERNPFAASEHPQHGHRCHYRVMVATAGRISAPISAGAGSSSTLRPALISRAMIP